MEHSNTISDKCITSAEFAAIAPVLGRIMDSDIEDCLDVLDKYAAGSGCSLSVRIESGGR